MILLDTDVMIDVLRAYAPALGWLDGLGNAPVGLPGLVALELVQGCRNREEQRRVEKSLQNYKLFWPTAAIFTVTFLVGQQIDRRDWIPDG